MFLRATSRTKSSSSLTFAPAPPVPTAPGRAAGSSGERGFVESEQPLMMMVRAAAAHHNSPVRVIGSSLHHKRVLPPPPGCKECDVSGHHHAERRSACVGSTRAALQAGTEQAASETPARRIAAARNVSGSPGETPRRKLDISLLAVTAASNPAA